MCGGGGDRTAFFLLVGPGQIFASVRTQAVKRLEKRTGALDSLVKAELPRGRAPRALEDISWRTGKWRDELKAWGGGAV